MADTRPLVPGDPPHLGPYALTGRLGEGGQGVVYLATAPDGREVAVKLLRVQADDHPGMRERFVRELAVLRRVAGFCTARVLDADVTGDRPYIVSEYVPGPSLQRLVATSGPLTGTALERLAVGTATSVAAVHRAGIAHRDLKPANVLMGPDGPRVIDFGIARVLGEAATITSAIVGTPAYMAPEQVEGGPIDTPVDVFAWAATMVFAATGRSPFTAETIPAVMSRVLHHDPDLDALPVPLRDIVAECLAKAPSARPTSQDLLLRLLDGETASAPAPARATAAVPPSGATATKLLEKTAAPETTATRPPAPRPRRKPLVLAVAASTAVLLSAGGATLWLNRDHPARSPFSIPAYAQDALRHAGPAYNTMNTFDYRALDADVRKAGSVETASYQRARADTLDRFEDDARARNLTVTTTTTTTGLVQAAPDRVTVLVDAKVTTNENGRTTDANARARLLLVHQNGSWLVDKADAINRDIIKNDPTGVQWPAPAASRLLNTARSCATSEILNSRNPTNLGGCADPTFTKQWPTLNKQLAALLQTPKTANITLPAMETGLISARTANDATVIVAANVGAAVLNQTFPTKTVQLRMTMKRSGDRWLITHESLS